MEKKVNFRSIEKDKKEWSKPKIQMVGKAKNTQPMVCGKWIGNPACVGKPAHH